MKGLRKYYKLKHASEVKYGHENTKIIPCSNCGRLLRIQAYWIKKKGYKNFFCDKKCEAQFRNYGKNIELKGGYKHNKTGYWYVRIDGMPKLKHRVIMERHLGRKLKRAEEIHHINGVRDDNRLENLMIVDWRKHPTQTQKIIKTLQKRIRELEYVVSKTGK